MNLDLTLNVSSVILAVAALVAVFSAITARAALNINRHMQQWAINYSFLSHAHDMIISDPTLLCIYDVDPGKLATDGITSSELIFIYSHMDAGSAYHRLGNDKRVHLTDFRKNFLKNAKVRIAWKNYMRERMFSPSPFRKAVDDFIVEYERSLPCNH